MIFSTLRQRSWVALLTASAAALAICAACEDKPPSPLPPPADLVAIGGENQVSLSWQPSARATGYTVLRSDVSGGPYVTVIQTAFTHAVNTGLPGNKTYYYVVTADRTTGSSSQYSNEATATTGPMPPPAPTLLTAVGGDLQVTLTWAASPGSTGYQILRSPTPGKNRAQVGTAATTEYTDTDLANGETRYYVIRATNSGGASDDSNELQATALSGFEICALDTSTRSIMAFDAEQNGDEIPIRRFGWLTGLAGATSIRIDPETSEIYVATFQSGPSERSAIVVFAADAAGNVAPSRIVAGPSTKLNHPTAMEIDGTNHELYVANSSDNSITIYPISDSTSGDIPPVRSIAGDRTQLASPIALGLDFASNHLIVLNDAAVPYITYYALDAADNARPIGTLEGSALGSPSSLAVDSDNGLLWLADSNNSRLLVLSCDANGDYQLERQFTDLSLNHPRGIALSVGPGTREVLVANDPTDTSESCSVTIYSSPDLSDPTSTPELRWTVRDAWSTMMSPLGLALNGANEIHVLNGGLIRGVTAYAYPTDEAEAVLEVAPARNISGATSHLSEPRAFCADSANGEIFVADRQGATAAILVYQDVVLTPFLRTIKPQIIPALQDPKGMAIDPLFGDVVVADPSNNRVLFFLETASEEVSPRIVIEHASLDGPSAVDVAFSEDGSHSEIFVANAGNSMVSIFQRDETTYVHLKDITAAVNSSNTSEVLSKPLGLAYDSRNGELWILNSEAPLATAVLKKDAAGELAFDRFLTSTALKNPYGIAVYPDLNAVFIADGDGILVFPRTAPETGWTPSRTISGSQTGLLGVSGIAVCK
jgi:hypothetical protein